MTRQAKVITRRGFVSGAAAATTALSAGLAPFRAMAQSSNDIVSRGVIKIGLTTGTPPFATIDDQGKAAGYDIDVANLLAKYLGVRAELSSLAPAARVPSLLSSKVDVLVATLAPTPERAKTVMFTMPYNSFNLGMFARKDANIKGIEDLKGKTVGITQGTSQAIYVDLLKAQGTNVIYFESPALVGQALISGQEDVAAIPNNIGRELAQANSGIELKYTYYRQPNAMAVRKDAFDLHQWLNNFIYYIKVNGELDAISRKWVGEPLADLPSF